jgi:hypothetical protein
MELLGEFFGTYYYWQEEPEEVQMPLTWETAR